MEKKIIACAMALIMISSMFFLAKMAAVYTISYEEETEQTKDKTDGSKIVIVIDAGHGGSDPGKVGVNGALEKDINLSIAKLVYEKLTDAKFEVVMTRESDETPVSGNGKAADMRYRIQQINESDAALLVSIHQNSFSDSSAKGPQVFYYDTSQDGEKAAALMQTQLNEGLKIEKPRQIKANDNYYLLKKSEIPAIIVECGFLSNSAEAELLCDEEYQEKLAENIFLAISEYFAD